MKKRPTNCLKIAAPRGAERIITFPGGVAAESADKRRQWSLITTNRVDSTGHIIVTVKWFALREAK